MQKQEEMIESLGSGVKPIEQKSNTNAIKSLVNNSTPEPMNIQHNPTGGFGRGMGGRTVSASTLDVWGEMTLGDITHQSGYEHTPVMQSPTRAVEGTGDFPFSQPETMPAR